MRRYRFTAAEEAAIRERVPVDGAAAVAADLGRTAASVCSKAHRMGVTVRRYTPPTEHPWRKPVTFKRMREMARGKP
jgi:hypothetical protein